MDVDGLPANLNGEPWSMGVHGPLKISNELLALLFVATPVRLAARLFTSHEHHPVQSHPNSLIAWPLFFEHYAIVVSTLHAYYSMTEPHRLAHPRLRHGNRPS